MGDGRCHRTEGRPRLRADRKARAPLLRADVGREGDVGDGRVWLASGEPQSSRGGIASSRHMTCLLCRFVYVCVDVTRARRSPCTPSRIRRLNAKRVEISYGKESRAQAELAAIW